MTVPETPIQPCLHPDTRREEGFDSDQTNNENEKVEGADGGYAWVVVGAILFSFSVSWGTSTFLLVGRQQRCIGLLLTKFGMSRQQHHLRGLCLLSH